MNVNPTLADGQLANTATSLGTGLSGLLNIMCCNTGASAQTVLITLTRVTNAVARQISRVVLNQNESLYISGLGVGGLDILKGSTTTATQVDYTITAAPDNAGPFEVQVLDANGAIKATANVPAVSSAAVLSTSPTGGVGYAAGAGGAVTQITTRTTGVTLNTVTGAITLVSAAGSATPASFTVTNSAVAATDTVVVNCKSATDLYEIFVTAVAAGSFKITSFTTGGTTTETPVFNFAVLKGAAS